MGRAAGCQRRCRGLRDPGRGALRLLITSGEDDGRVLARAEDRLGRGEGGVEGGAEDTPRPPILGTALLPDEQIAAARVGALSLEVEPIPAEGIAAIARSDSAALIVAVFERHGGNAQLRLE